jgi:SAM-dependent methyltransferase
MIPHKYQKIAEKILPKRLLVRLFGVYKSLIKYPNLLIYRGSKHSCPFCSHSFRKFLPGGLDFQVLKDQKVIGGGYRLNSFCPYCRSSDRERLVYLFIKHKRRLGTPRKIKLLHVAPEKNLYRTFQRIKNIDYITGDLNRRHAKIKMDIRNIKFPDNHFDAIICNHVLEHIPEDRKAMSELYRVLKPKSWAILQVPISKTLKKTYEDPKISTPLQREKFFGQSDHVRIYAKDYKQRLEKAGFRVEPGKLDARTTRKYCLNKDEKVYFCKK